MSLILQVEAERDMDITVAYSRVMQQRGKGEGVVMKCEMINVVCCVPDLTACNHACFKVGGDESMII